MEELKALLEQYLSEYKTYTVVILFIINLCVIVFNAVLVYYLNSKLLKLKKQQDLILKKNEMFQVLQIEAIKHIYPKIVKLDLSTELLQDTVIYHGENVTDRFKMWIDNYNDLSNSFFANDLFFNNDFSKMINSFLKLHKKLYIKLINNKSAIEKYTQESKQQHSTVEILDYTRGKLSDSVDELQKIEEEFAKSHGSLKNFIKDYFRKIIIV